MKVVVSGYVGKKITGIGRNIISLLENSDSSIEFVIYVPYDMVDDFKFNAKNVVVKTYPISKMSSLKNLIWTSFKFPKIVKEENADLCLIPNFTWLRKKVVPTIVIMHDLIEFNVKNKFSPLKMFYRTKIADPKTAKRADHIITVSQNSKNDIIKFLKVNPSKISVIYDGVNSDFFSHKMMDDYAINQFNEKKIGEHFLLYVGTVDHPGKNAISIVKAFEELRDSGKYSGQCVLAGMPGSGYEIVEAYCKESKYLKDILLLGYTEDKLLPYLYSKCDVFLFLSLYEGFGIPPLEALSCGARVIVSNNSSLPEVVGDCGKIVNPTNVPEICDAIVSYLSEPSMSQDVVAKQVDKFNWKELAIQFSNCLSKVYMNCRKEEK